MCKNFDRISHAIEDLVGITSNKDHPHIGIVGPITAVWMLFELRYRLANAGRYVPRAARWIALSNIGVFALDRRTPQAYSVLSSFVALVGFGDQFVRHELPAIGLS